MALSLESIYRPFNDFFVQKFAASGATANFRFDAMPRAFVDHDFLTPLHPEWGPSPAVAAELLSTLVADGVTHLDPDGQRVTLGPSRLSALYHDEILGPAIPSVTGEGVNPADQQPLTDAFNAVKADAVGLWEHLKAASVLMDGDWVRLVVAQPGSWWDPASPDAWITQTFQIQGAATSSGPAEGVPAKDRLLRMKVDDAALATVIRSRNPSSGVVFRPSGPVLRPFAPLLGRAQTLEAVRPLSGTAFGRLSTLTTAPAMRPAQTNFALHDQIMVQSVNWSFRDRLEVQEVLASDAPTQPVTTSDVSIRFDYCVVRLTRDWLHAGFLNNRFWRVPGQVKGQLSANDGHGLPAIPVGFVAIKNLSIQAPWTPEDISNLEQSVQFGPFNFDSQVVNGAIGHSGIQIIGWLLQDLPDLPPTA